MGAEDSTISDVRVAALESENASLRGELARTRDALASLRARYHQIIEELHLLKRRLHVAKAERLDDVADAQLAFDRLTAEADALEKVLEGAEGHTDAGAAAPPPPAGKARKKSSTKPTGRRKLSDCDLPEVRVEIPDPELEGKFERIGFDESSRVGFERGGRRRVVCARVVYKDAVKPTEKTEDAESGGRPGAAGTEPRVDIRVAPMPKEIMPRGILAPSMIAHLLAIKYVLSVPFHRYEQQTAREGFKIDRGTMCRYAEHVGATFGCIVEATRKEAIATPFCIATDATGVAVQPTRIEGKHQACRKGHFFVSLADKDPCGRSPAPP
jgi:hypothetical protein